MQFLEHLSPQGLAQVLTERMLNGILESAVLAVVACLLLKAIGRRSSGTRFAVWFVVLLSTVALPFIEVQRHPSSVAAHPADAAILIPSSWALYLFCIWGVISAGFLGRVALGLMQIRGLRRECTPLDLASLEPGLMGAVSTGARPIELYVTDSLRVPMATGFLRPMIVIPSWALRELSPENLKVVLLHEAAHLRRWDDWTNLAQKILRALFFFHPVVWWVESKLALEREMACDDIVVAATSSPRAYAACLIAVAEKNLGRRGLALAQAAVHRMRHTSMRIRGILDGRRPSAVRIWKPAVGLMLALALVCIGSMREMPRLVGFHSPVSGPATIASATVPVPSRGTLHLTRASLALPVPRAAAKSRPAPTRRIVPEVETVATQPEFATDRSDDAILPDQPARVVPASAQFQNSGTSQAFGFAATETVFVVTQDPQVSATGNQMFRVRVYRWTVFYPSLYFENTRKPLSKSI